MNTSILVVSPPNPIDLRAFLKERKQAIWYISYNAEEDSHKIGTKYFKTDEPINVDFVEDYLVLIKRTTNTIFSEEEVDLNDNPFNAKYRYYLPDIDGLHRKKKSFVIWNIETFCINCYAEFNVKYFDCDDAARNFYDDLEDSDKRKVIFRTVSESNYEFGDYENEIEIQRVLTNLMECEPGITTNDCCMPYPCLVNAQSINCVCALSPQTPECLCAKAGNCDTFYTTNEIVQ